MNCISVYNLCAKVGFSKNNYSIKSTIRVNTWRLHNTQIYFLVSDQRDAQIPFYVFIFIYNSLHVSGTSCSSSGEINFINTTSGNYHSVSVAVSWCRLGV